MEIQRNVFISKLMAQKSNMKLITHINPEGVKSNINPLIMDPLFIQTS